MFKVGVGREIITPKIGTRTFGYGSKVYTKSVNDDLTVTAIAFKSNEETAVLVSATVCLISIAVCNRVRKAIFDATGIKGENVIISATHTHSGPCTDESAGIGDYDDGYCQDVFIPEIVKATKTAINNLEDAVMGIGTVKSEIGINRRQLFDNNKIGLGQNPWGCYDPNLTVINFKNLSDKPIVNIIHYGAHLTASGCNDETTRDWAGVMVDRLEKITGAVTAFFNGAEGDVGPRLSNGLTMGSTSGDISYAMELGGAATLDALNAYRNINEYRDVDLNIITDEVRLPYDDVIPLCEAEEKIKDFEAHKDEKNLPGRKYRYYKAVIDTYKNNIEKKEYFKYDQTIVKIGPVAFVPFPFEFFSEISLRLRSYSKIPYLLCLGCTNGSYGYLPTEDQICRGGYEVESFLSYNAQILKRNTDYNIIKENLRILEGF